MCTKEAFRCARTLFYNLLPSLKLRLASRLVCADRGSSEVDGSDPPILPPGSALWGQADVHRRAIAWEGRSRPISPMREGL